MAIRQEELLVREAVIYRFPTEAIARREARMGVMRRRRVTLGIAAVVLAVGLLAAWSPAAPAGQATDTPRAVVVAPGETLWHIADAYAPPTEDPRAYIDRLQELNGLEGPIRAGMRLKLPR